MAESRGRRPLYALTLHRPWSWAISHGPKRVENRDWEPPKRLIGQLIAIHAGRTWEDAAAEHLLVRFSLPVPGERQLVAGAFVAIARLARVITRDSEEAYGNPWFVGDYGWVLEDVVALPGTVLPADGGLPSLVQPVVCRGAQKLWQVREPELSRVRDAYLSARRQQAEAAQALLEVCRG